MLNQAAGDRQILAKQLNISPHQLSYVTHSGEGEGLLFYGNVILPFLDRFPKDTELYQDVYKRQEYGLEQVYNVVDSRYRSNKPLIVTTNLTLEELQNPEDTPHARIYDRLLEMCSPVCFTGENFRKATAQEKMERLKTLMNGKESL